MAIVDIVQRSEAWFPWRKTGITASMIPVIMGLSPYQTPYQLWAELVGLKEPQDLSNNFHVQRGVAQEPEARDAVENEFGKPYMPVCVEADHNSLFKASLDGLYSLGTDKEVLEIKCPCEKIYNEILQLQGQAPSFQMYAAQVQWQLNCASATSGRLYFWLRGKRPINTAIRRNDAFIAKAEERALWFWNLIQTKTPPPMIEGRDNEVYDFPEVDNTWLSRVEQYKEKSEHLASMESKAKAIKSDLKKLEAYFTDKVPKNVKTFDKDGIRATRVERNGNVDYPMLLDLIEKELNVIIPENLKVQATKKSTEYFRVTVTDTECQVVQTEQESKPTKASEPVQSEPLQPKQDDSWFSEKESNAVENVNEESSPSAPIHPLPADNFFEKSATSTFF